MVKLYRELCVILLLAEFALLNKALFFKIERHPDADLTIDQTVAKYGYPVETHTVTTPDGYILTLHRIPHGKGNSNKTNNNPVLLQHGMFGTSKNFITIGENSALAYYLADRGYDVWLGNARGNLYSRKHVRLNPDTDSRFWQFSWHEIGIIDNPTTIDYILTNTKKAQLHYVGHSQGSTSLFVMASDRPEYNEKIKVSIHLGPTAFMKHVKNKIGHIVSPYHYQLYDLSVLLNLYELIPNLRLVIYFAKRLCEELTVFREVWATVIFLVGGFNSEQLNRSIIPIILNGGLSSTSTLQNLHYFQGIMSGKFRQFDFGPMRNWKKYKSEYPPDYNLKNVTSPVALFYGCNDWLTSPKDVKHLRQLLPNVVLNYLVSFKKFTHMDFIFARDVAQLVYEPAYKLMQKYNDPDRR